MFTLDQIECSSITSPLSLSLFLASQVTSFSHLRSPHHHHRPSPVATRKAVLHHPLRSTVHFSPRPRFTHSPLTLTHSPLRLTHIDRLKKITACSSSHKSAPVSDRLISAAVYSITFLDGVGYGMRRIPSTMYPPIFHHYNSSMFMRVISFFVVLLFVIRDPKFSKYVRINALQAIIFGVVLPLPATILQRFIFPVWPVGMLIGYDFMFAMVVFGFIHVMVNTILGKTPEFPVVTEAAEMHLRGF